MFHIIRASFLVMLLTASIVFAFADTTNVMAPDVAILRQAGRKERARLNQLASQYAKEKAWSERVYIASPNVFAKCTSMTNAVNAQGQIMRIDVVTYWKDSEMRYATGAMNTAESK